MALRNLASLLVFALAACGDSQPRAEGFRPLKAGVRDLYVVASDFTTGAIYRVDLNEGQLSQTVFPAHADATARFDPKGSRLLVVNRLAGNHLTLASADLTQVLGQWAFPEASNPQDVLSLGNGEAWVSYLKSASVERRNLETGAVSARVDLSEWADADGYPEASFWIATAETAWIALQRLDTRIYQPAGSGYVIPISKNGEIDRERIVELSRGNPFTEIKPFGDRLCVGAVGKLDRAAPVLDGAVECWPTEGGAVTEIVDERSLGGDILDFDLASETAGLAITSHPRTDLVFFDPSGGSVPRTLVMGNGYQFSHLLADPERQIWYVADRSSEKPAIRVFGWDGVEREEARIPLSLPPFRLTLGQ